MIDEDELDEVEEGLVDLAMRGWRTLDEHPLDPRSKRVQLEHNELSTLPKTIGTLEFMWKLDVSHNRLEALPRTIGKCTRLRILNVDHNYLEDVPKELGQCFFLEEINAEHNSLVTVPASLGSLQQLRELKLKHNRLENLPVEIGGLDTLEVLDCSENENLAMVPEKLRDDSEMVKFVIKLHYDTLKHITQIKQNYADVKDALQKQEHANLRLRDAIEQCKADKEAIIESLVPDEVADTCIVS